MNIFSPKKKKIGLALGSGAARGLAHIGVFEAINQLKVPIDMISGSSIGALIGAYYAKNLNVKGIKDITLSLDFPNLIKLLDPNFLLFFKGVISGKKVEKLLEIILGDIDFKDLKIPLLVAATDITTGEGLIIDKGSVVEAVRASISIPAFFTPVKLNNKFLIDGGIANPIPVNVLRKKGMDYIIASNVVKQYTMKSLQKNTVKQTKPKVPGGAEKIKEQITLLLKENEDVFQRISKLLNSLRKLALKRSSSIDKNTPSIFETVIAAIYSMEYQIARLQLKNADLIISPEVDSLGSLEFFRAQEAITAGYKKAFEVLKKIK